MTVKLQEKTILEEGSTFSVPNEVCSNWLYIRPNLYSIPCFRDVLEVEKPVADVAPLVTDYDARVRLLMLAGLPTVLEPDDDGLDKTRGLLSDATVEGFDVVSFVKSIREDI